MRTHIHWRHQRRWVRALYAPAVLALGRCFRRQQDLDELGWLIEREDWPSPVCADLFELLLLFPRGAYTEPEEPRVLRMVRALRGVTPEVQELAVHAAGVPWQCLGVTTLHGDVARMMRDRARRESEVPVVDDARTAAQQRWAARAALSVARARARTSIEASS